VEVQRLLSCGAQVFPEDGILAAQRGKAEIVAELLRKSESLKKVSLMLFWAAMNGWTKVVELLVKNGIEASVQFGDGMTAFHCAAMRGHVEVVEWLVEEGGAQVNEEVSQGGMTALHFAVEQGKLNVIKYLVQRLADVNAQTVDGITPLALASEEHVEVCSFLTKLGAKLSVQDKIN